MIYPNKSRISLILATSVFGNNIERKNQLHSLLCHFSIETRAGKHYTNSCLNSVVKLLKLNCDIIVFPQGVFDDNHSILKARIVLARILFEALEFKNIKINLVTIVLEISNLNENNIRKVRTWSSFKAKVTNLKQFAYDEYYKKYKGCNTIMHLLLDDMMLIIAPKMGLSFKKRIFLCMIWMDFGFQMVNILNLPK